VAYLTNSFGHFVSPPFGARVFPFLLVCGIAEVAFALTLLVRGVDAERWNQSASENRWPCRPAGRSPSRDRAATPPARIESRQI